MIQLRESLISLCKRGVICKVEKPTEWVNRLSIQIKKTGKLRLCLDPRGLNEAIIREIYHTPVFDELTTHLSRVKIFSKFDLSDGFWHCVLDQESSMLTAFQTSLEGFASKDSHLVSTRRQKYSTNDLFSYW